MDIKNLADNFFNPAPQPNGDALLTAAGGEAILNGESIPHEGDRFLVGNLQVKVVDIRGNKAMVELALVSMEDVVLVVLGTWPMIIDQRWTFGDADLPLIAIRQRITNSVNGKAI